MNPFGQDGVRRFPLLLTGPVGPLTALPPSVGSENVSPDILVPSCFPEHEPETLAIEGNPVPESSRDEWERLVSSRAWRQPSALFRPEVAGAEALETPYSTAPTDAAGEGGRSERESLASRASEIIEAFLIHCGARDRVRGDEAVLLFWDLGRFLCESRREFPRISDGDYDSWFSRQIVSDFRSVKSLLIGYGFDVESLFSAEGIAEMQRLARMFPRDYLERIARPLAVMPGGVWTYVREIIALPDPYERVYYAEMASRFRWTLAALRANVKMQRFHTHTIARQSDAALGKALVQLGRGDLSEWVYRDLLRFDFLKGGEEFKDMTEPKFEEFMLARVREIAAEFGDGFTFAENQAVRYYEDADGNRKFVRLDILGQVGDGAENYPLVIELKKGPFTEAVLQQCLLYKHVMRGKDAEGNRVEPGGYLKPSEKKVLVMALVTKFDREYEKIMEVGLRKDGRRSSVFVSLYTYDKPPQEFLDKAIGAQLKFSAARAARDEARLADQKATFRSGALFGEAEELFATILKIEDYSGSETKAGKDPQVPF